jgi:hypothetical protein
MATVVPQFRNPWVQNLPNYLQNVALTKMAQRFRAGEGQKDRDFRAEEAMKARSYSREQKELDRSFALGTSTGMQQIPQEHLPAGTPYVHDPVTGKFFIKYRKPDTTTQIKNYNMAMRQYLQGTAPYPGNFSEYTKAQSRAGATKISLGEKVAEVEAKSDAKIRQEVKKPGLRNKTINFLKSQDQDWEYKDKYVQEEAIFKEMDRQIQVAHKNKAVFDEGRNPPGWYVGNKLVRSWKDPFKHRSDNIR